MKTRKTFWPDNPYMLTSYLLVGLVCFWLFHIGMVDGKGFFGSLGLVIGIFAYNSYLWRIEVSEGKITGPGHFGPMTRVTIPWKQARVQTGVKKAGLRYLIIKQQSGVKQLEIAEANFSGNTLRTLKQIFKFKNVVRGSGSRPAGG